MPEEQSGISLLLPLSLSLSSPLHHRDSEEDKDTTKTKAMAATQDVLASILAELQALRTSQAKLESRLDGVIAANGGGSNPAAASSGAAPQGIPIRSSPSPHTLSPALGPSSPGQVGSPPSLGGSSLSHARKYSMDNGNASKQEYLNWARNNSASTQPASAQDKETAAVSAIYPSRAVLTSACSSVVERWIRAIC